MVQQPPGSAHPVEMEAELPLGDSPTPTRPTRAKLSAPFTDGQKPARKNILVGGSGYTVWTEKQRLVLTNTGSRERNRPGFLYCHDCGRTQPNGWGSEQPQSRGGHTRPNPDYKTSGSICTGYATTVVLGNEFETDIALLRFNLSRGANLKPGSIAAKIVLTTTAEALATAAAKILDLEPSDIGAEYRVAMTEGGRTGEEVEIYLYDLTPGGAGFVSAAVKDPELLFKEALTRLESCKCTHSCYECLRSYKNKWDHKYLDRNLAAEFLHHICRGDMPTIGIKEEARLLRMMEVDLAESDHAVENTNGGLRLLSGSNRVVVVGHPMVSDEAGTAAGRKLISENSNHVIIDKLLIDRALPAAIKKAIGVSSDGASNDRNPPILPVTGDGLPVYALDSLSPHTQRTVIERVSLTGAPAGAFVIRLDRSIFSSVKWPLSEGSIRGLSSTK